MINLLKIRTRYVEQVYNIDFENFALINSREYYILNTIIIIIIIRYIMCVITLVSTFY